MSEQTLSHENEIWKPAYRFENLYEVSNQGRVRSLDRYIQLKNGNMQFRYGRIVKFDTMTGYHRITLCDGERRIRIPVHRLVLMTFSHVSQLDVDHINGKRKDNRLCNLEYVTKRENMCRSKVQTQEYVGVYKRGDKYRVVISIDGKMKHFGHFKDIEDAIRRRNQVYEEFGILFPSGKKNG